ncbi:MAG: DUF423 domain-containing protein [Bacteroidia bacterium]
MQLKPSNFLLIAAVLGAIAVAFGALGAHSLEETLTAKQLQDWATAVRYQMWHSLLLVALATGPLFKTAPGQRIGLLFILGVIFFSGSIYLLTAGLSFLWPVTPVGGLLLVTGWVLLAVWAWRNKQFFNEK